MALPTALSGLGLRRPNPNQRYEDLKEAAKRARLPFDKDVWLNVAFYLDEQYIEWADDFATLRRTPRREGFENTPRPVANKIMHFVAQEHAMALQNRPNPDVLPATDSVIDVSDANVALAYLKYLCEPQLVDFDSVLSDATLWALIGGEGYLKFTYNDSLGRPDIVSCSPLDVFIDPYCKTFNRARYIIHEQFMDVEQVYDVYGVEVKPQDVARADPTRAALLRDMGASPVLQGAIVNELWMRPNRRFPEGRFVAWTGREVLVDPVAFPYDHGHLPFIQIGSIPRPGSPHYTCAVKYLRAPQMELNKYHSQKIMGREAFVNYKWWLPEELELEQLPDDSPRQVLRGNSMAGTLKPEILTPPPLPDNNDGAWISQEMMNVVGLHEVSQAQVPGRVEAAKAIELLKEADSSRLAELQRTIKSGISEGFWQTLQLCKQYVKDDIVVQAYSREGFPEVRHFKAKEQIQEGMRVNVTMGTGLSASRAARQDELLLYWQNGIVSDPDIFAELMDMPVATFSPSRVHDIRLARNENFIIAEGDAGTAVKPNSWDDHRIHIREHNDFRKTEEYLTLPAETKNKFEFHVQQHESQEIAVLEKQVQKQQLVMAALQGPVPPPDSIAGEAPPAGAQGAAAGQPPADGQETPQGQAEQRDFTDHNLRRGEQGGQGRQRY